MADLDSFSRNIGYAAMKSVSFEVGGRHVWHCAKCNKAYNMGKRRRMKHRPKRCSRTKPEVCNSRKFCYKPRPTRCVDKISSEFLDIWNELTTATPEPTVPSGQLNESVIVPLEFWFNRDPSGTVILMPGISPLTVDDDDLD